MKSPLSVYTDGALPEAIYDKLEDGSLTGCIPVCKGIVAMAGTLREREEELCLILEGMKKTWLMFLCLAALLGPGSRSYATTVGLLDLEPMVSQSSAIFLGICNSSKSRWDAGKRMIFTDSAFLVKEYLKGDLGPVLTITEPGGVLPEFNLALVVPHLPQFREGEEVVLFVWTDPQGIHRVLGGSQGKHRVSIDPVTDDKLVQGAPLAEFLRRIESHMSSK